MFIETIKFNVIVLPLNPLVPNAPYLYPLKTAENLFLYFQKAEKMCIRNECVKWAVISLFKLSLRSDFKTVWQSTSDAPEPYFSKSNMEKLQSELLKCQLSLETL